MIRFAELSVSNRVISVSHDGGGGRFTWQYLHKYRYDKKDKIWKVVGATITHLDKSKKVETQPSVQPWRSGNGDGYLLPDGRVSLISLR